MYEPGMKLVRLTNESSKGIIVTEIAPTFVDSLPESAGRGRSKKYDFTKTYEALLKNGKAAQIVRGKQFVCSGISMRQFIYKDAKEHNLKATVRNSELDDGTEVVTFSVEKETEADRKAAAERAERRAANKAAKEKEKQNSKPQSEAKEPVTA